MKLFKQSGIFRFTDRSDTPLIIASAICLVIAALGAPLETYLYGKIFTKLSEFLLGSTQSKALLGKVRLICGEIIVVGAVRMVFTWLGVIGWLMIGERSHVRGRRTMFRCLLDKDLQSIERHKNLMGSLTQAYRCMEEIRIGVSENLGILIQTSTSIVFLFVTSMISLWLLTLVILASSPLMVLSSYGFGKLARQYSMRENRSSAIASRILEWSFESAKMVRSLHGKYFDMARFGKIVDLSAKQFTFFFIAIDANSSIMRALGSLVFVQGLVFAQYLVAAGKATSGQVFTSFSACLLLGSLIASLSDLLAMINKAQASALSMDELGVIQAAEHSMSNDSLPQLISKTYSVSTILVEDISFAYRDVETPILERVNATFNTSGFNFIIGLSGSGKSTLGCIIAGLYEQSEGHVRIDGITQPFRGYSNESILLVHLHPSILEQLLKSNISLGCGSIDESRLVSAIYLADLQDFVASLPLGLNSTVDEKELSGGQLQKIGLARAFLIDPPVLILDEALSAIDSHSRKRIMANLRERRRGQLTLLVTHDSQDIEPNDDICMLSAGRVTRFGKKHQIGSALPVKLASQEKHEIEHIEKDGDQNDVCFRGRPACSSDIESQSDIDGSFEKESTYSLTQLLRFTYCTCDKKFMVLFGCFTAILTGLVPLVLSFLFSKILSKIVGHTSPGIRITWKPILTLIIAAIALIFGDGCVHFSSKALLHYVLETWINSLRKLSLSLINDQDMSFFSLHNRSPSDLNTLLMNDARDLRSVVSEFLPGICEMFALAVGGFVWSTVTGWRLTLVGYAFIPLILMITAAYGIILQGVEARYKSEVAELDSHCSKTMLGIKTIKSIGLESDLCREFEQKLKALFSIGLKRAIADGFGFSVLQLCTSAATATILYYGVFLIGKNEYSLEQMLFVLTLLIFTISGVTNVTKRLPVVSRGQRAARYISSIISSRALELEVGGVYSVGHRTEKATDAVILFQNVSKSYQDTNAKGFNQVLKNITFEIKKGESLTIVGKSGSGKSTIASLLLRLYNVDRGSIEVFGMEISSIKADDFRGAVTMVSQKPKFFEGSIRENILYGCQLPYVSEEAIWDVLRAVNAFNLVNGLQRGLDTCYGDDVLFSLGELQRLCIARALIRKPRILILDEPTSHLDAFNTQIVADLIGTGLRAIDKDLVVLTISHDSNLIKHAGRILKIDRGYVAQDGKFSG